jgi:hypothetical protein
MVGTKVWIDRQVENGRFIRYYFTIMEYCAQLIDTSVTYALFRRNFNYIWLENWCLTLWYEDS